MKTLFGIFGMLFAVKLAINLMFPFTLRMSAKNNDKGTAFSLPPPVEIAFLLLCVAIAMIEPTASVLGGPLRVLGYGSLALFVSYIGMFCGLVIRGWLSARRNR